MSKPLIAHVLYRLDYGGLENGLVNLINHLPADKYRHAIICLAGYSDFRRRIVSQDVEIYDLGKRPGKDPLAYWRLWRLLIRLRPNLVHTRNSGAIDCAAIAFFAAVRVRLHGCHGWDAGDLFGKDPRGRRLRRLSHPFISGYTAVSRDLRDWLVATDGIQQQRVSLVCNGVDCDQFQPGNEELFADITAAGPAQRFVIGTIGRLDKVKDQLTLVEAFALLVKRNPGLRDTMRLAIVGDGSQRQEIQALIDTHGLHETAMIFGWRDDIARVLQGFDVFCLPSLNEGISNTLLEAMATGLPAVATAVGGNVELVSDDLSGFLVTPGDKDGMANALEKYLLSNDLLNSHGLQARRRAEAEFSLVRMIGQYDEIYSGYLGLSRN